MILPEEPQLFCLQIQSTNKHRALPLPPQPGKSPLSCYLNQFSSVTQEGVLVLGHAKLPQGLVVLSHGLEQGNLPPSLGTRAFPQLVISGKLTLEHSFVEILLLVMFKSVVLFWEVGSQFSEAIFGEIV